MSTLPPESESDRKLLRLVHDRRQSSIDYVREKYRATEDYYKAFQGIYTGSIAPYLNDLSIPLIFATIFSSVARKANGIFGAWPIMTFQGFPEGASGIAKKNELLISLQLKEADSYRKSINFFTQADLNGTSVAEVGWTLIQRLRKYRTYVPGTFNLTEVTEPVTEFDGPNWDIVDLLDFWPEPGKTHITNMGWYIRRYWVSFDDLLELNSGDGLQRFDPNALARLAETSLPQAASASDEFLTYNRFRTFSDYVRSGGVNRFDRPVELWVMHGSVPFEFAPDGIRQRDIVIANGRVVLCNEPDKLLLARHRIVTYSPTPDPYHFVGIGKAQIAEPLQAAASRIAAQKLDALDLFIKPMFIAKQGAMKSQNLMVKPGRVFQADTRGASLADTIMPLIPNLQGVAQSFNEFAFLDRMIQKGTGISESAVMGMDSPQNEMTARQFLGQQEAAMTRLAMEAMLASVEFLEPMAELFRDENKTMLPLPKQFSMIGSRALINEVTGLPLPPIEGVILHPGELNHSWSAKAFGPMQMLTKSAQRADALQLSQVMMANPVWIQSLNWIAMARKIFSLYDWDPDEMLVQMVPQITQLAAGLGMSPEGAIAASGELGGQGGATGQLMAPVQSGIEGPDNAPLGVGP